VFEKEKQVFIVVISFTCSCSSIIWRKKEDGEISNIRAKFDFLFFLYIYLSFLVGAERSGGIVGGAGVPEGWGIS